MNNGFSKRIFTAKLFFVELGFLLRNVFNLIHLLFAKQNPKHLFEKIFIISDAVNGCIYCSWLDAKLALKSGMSQDEVNNLLTLQFHTVVSEWELNALLYAQHYAESQGKPDAEMTASLTEFYGEPLASKIVLAIRAVTFGNLYFNTWRAVISRFKGHPAPHSNVVFELIYFVLNFIIIVPVTILRKLDSKAIGIN